MKKPIINKPVDPVNVDLAVEAIRSSLDNNLDWLTYSFGWARSHTEKRNDTRYTYPRVYAKRKEYINVEPNDNWNAHTFIEVINPETKQGYTPNAYRHRINQRIDVVLFANLNRINPNEDYLYGERLKEEVENVLNKTPFVYDITSVFRGLDEAYRNYSIEEYDTKYLNDNYFAARFELEVSFTAKCPNGDPSSFIPASIQTSQAVNTASVLEYTANEPISVGKLVMVDNDGGVVLNQNDVANYGKYSGIALNSVLTGGVVKVSRLGLVDSPQPTSYGTLYFAGANGDFSSTVPNTGLSQIIGVGTDNNKLDLHDYEPIILG